MRVPFDSSKLKQNEFKNDNQKVYRERMSTESTGQDTKENTLGKSQSNGLFSTRGKLSKSPGAESSQTD